MRMVEDIRLMIGGLAQLVERLLCKQDVSGSSPLTSTDQPLNRERTACGDQDDGCVLRNSASAYSREG
jgi:hypothetical protein